MTFLHCSPFLHMFKKIFLTVLSVRSTKVSKGNGTLFLDVLIPSLLQINIVLSSHLPKEGDSPLISFFAVAVVEFNQK